LDNVSITSTARLPRACISSLLLSQIWKICFPRTCTSSHEDQGKHSSFLQSSAHIVTFDSRSRSLGEIKIQQGPAYFPAALEQEPGHAARIYNRSRSTSGHLSSVSSDEALYSSEHDRELIDADSQEVSSSIFHQTHGDITEDTFEEASSPITEQNSKDDGEVENNWSPTTSDNSWLDQDTSLWSIGTDFWSPCTPETPASFNTTQLIPLPAPNSLTSTFLPFSSHLALTNHFNPSTIARFQLIHTPIFLHGMLQLPCTLSALLGLPTSDLLCRLTPAILLDHTTYLDPTTLLPSLAKPSFTSTYHHVDGLLYFPKDSSCVGRLNDYFSPQTSQVEMREVVTQIQDSNGKRHEVAARAWVARAAEGTEEWWTCEDFIAGRVIGLENVKW
jgi:hypothetical protein